MKITAVAARIAALTLVGGGAVIATATGVSAGPAPDTERYKCVEVVHTSTKDIVLTGGATAVIADSGGVVFTTPAVESKVHWQTTVSPKVPMKAVTAMRYTTRKLDDGKTNAAALPAYRIWLTGTSGPNEDTVLVFEPYYQLPGNPALNTTQTWDVLAGKFWATKSVGGITAEAGGSYAGNRTWAQIKAANPHAKVVAYGVGQGTYNAGTEAKVNHVVFAGGGKCAEHVWCKPAATPTPTPTVTATSTTVPGGNAGGDKPGLPVTGVSVPVLVGGAAVLLVAGAAFLVLTRRRRVRFTAT